MIKKINPFPEDIIQKLKYDFEDEKEYIQALSLLDCIRNDTLNVGWIQLCRAVLLISNGNLQKLKDIIQKKYYGDPRDVIMEMMALPGNKNNYGTSPFKIDN